MSLQLQDRETNNFVYKTFKFENGIKRLNQNVRLKMM